jgi:amino acid transporter
MNKPLVATSQPGLLRVLGPWMGTALVIGTVIGSGVFKKPYAVAQSLPEFGTAILAWVLVGLLAMSGALVLAEIAVLLPRAGGNYVFLREGFGRWAGFLYGWVEFWIIRSASIAALAAVFAESLHAVLRGVLTSDGLTPVFPPWGEPAITVVVIAVLAIVNAGGTTWGGGLQVLVTTIKVLSLVGIALLPLVAILIHTGGDATPSAERLEPIWPTEVGGLGMRFGLAMVAIWWAYHGWMNIAPVAEEVRNPGRNIPLSLIVGTLTVMALYVSANIAYHLVVPRDVMIDQGKNTPVAALFCLRLLGNIGLTVAAAAVMMSVFGALNGNLLVGPRLLYAMGRDGLAPNALARLHAPFNTPVIAVLTLAAWSIALIIGVTILVQYRLPEFTLAGYKIDPNLKPGAAAFDTLTDYAMFGSFSFETLAVATLFAFRRRYPPQTTDLPYRCPLYPWLPAVYVLAMTAVLVNYFRENVPESCFAVGFIAVGAIVYLCVFGKSPESVAIDQGG